MKIRESVTFSNVVAVLALFLALGGGAYATVELKKLKANSVGTKQLKNNAVKSAKVADNSLTGSDLDESTLGKVPSAASADNAAKLGGQDASAYLSAASSGFDANQCNPSSSTLVDCTSTTLDLPHPGQVLLVAAGGEVGVAGDGSGSCQFRIDGNLSTVPEVIPGGSTLDHYQSFYQNGFSVTSVTDSLNAGSHTFALACSQSTGDVKFFDTTISAMLAG
jgi:hypothetical protein